jgi:hypothetical protein
VTVFTFNRFLLNEPSNNSLLLSQLLTQPNDNDTPMDTTTQELKLTDESMKHELPNNIEEQQIIEK